jgi:hypothetical protein
MIKQPSSLVHIQDIASTLGLKVSHTKAAFPWDVDTKACYAFVLAFVNLQAWTHQCRHGRGKLTTENQTCLIWSVSPHSCLWRHRNFHDASFTWVVLTNICLTLACHAPWKCGIRLWWLSLAFYRQTPGQYLETGHYHIFQHAFKLSDHPKLQNLVSLRSFYK